MASKSLNGILLTASGDDVFHKDEALIPEHSIVMDGVTYTADRGSNTISLVLESYDIHSCIEVSTIQQNIGGRYTKVNGFLNIKNMTVIEMANKYKKNGTIGNVHNRLPTREIANN